MCVSLDRCWQLSTGDDCLCVGVALMIMHSKANWPMPQHVYTDHVTGGVVGSAVRLSADLSTSVDTSNSSTPATAPPASTATTTSNDERLAEDMETSMTTTADVQVHERQQRDNAPASRHVRFDWSYFCQCLVAVKCCGLVLFIIVS